jgi:hypothetical protein
MPGVAPEFMTMIQIMQQQNAATAQAAADAAIAAEQRFRRQRADDTKRHEDAQRAQHEALVAFQRSSQQMMKTVTDEAARLSVQRHESARPSSIKLPSFDLEKDRCTFKQWHDR